MENKELRKLNFIILALFILGFIIVLTAFILGGKSLGTNAVLVFLIGSPYLYFTFQQLLLPDMIEKLESKKNLEISNSPMEIKKINGIGHEIGKLNMKKKFADKGAIFCRLFSILLAMVLFVFKMDEILGAFLKNGY